MVRLIQKIVASFLYSILILTSANSSGQDVNLTKKAYVNTINSYLENENYQQAKVYVDKLLTLTSAPENDLEQEQLLNLQIKTHKGLNDYERALYFSEALMAVKLRINENASQERIDKIEAELILAEQEKHKYIIFTLCIIFILIAIWLTVLSRKNALLTSQKKQSAENAQKTQQADRVNNDYLAQISNEIRIQMNTIIAMNGLVLKTELGDKQRHHVSKAYRSAKNLLGTINNIIDFSTIEAGQLSIKNTPFVFEDIFKDLTSISRVTSDNKAIEVIFDIAPEIDQQVMGDRLKLGQILTNLINYAMKFTPNVSEVVVRAGLVNSADNVINVQFSVQDNGIGMTPEQQEKHFQAYEQADIFSSKDDRATGLTWLVSKKIVEAMGGKIQVESEKNQGSCFYFTVELGRLESTETDKTRAVDISSFKILVVDDNKNARAIITAYLENYGCVVQSAKDGEAALSKLAKAQRKPFDLIIIDDQMPRPNSIETIKAAINNPLITQKPKTILMTAYGNSLLKRQDNDKFVNHLLTKPICPSDLQSAISALMSQPKHTILATPEEDELKLKVKQLLVGKRILLVEDDTFNQELACELLSESGMSVIIANNGQEALEALKHERFDCVLMDCQMPVMDGYQATHEIRKIPELISLPVLAMTANARESEQQKIAQAGMNDIIVKPLDVNIMRNTLAKWIMAKRLDISPATTPAGKEELLTITPSVSNLGGIDIKRGLQNCNNNENLYHYLLTSFSENYHNFSQQLSEQTDDSSKDMFIHTIKGACGSIGAVQLMNSFVELEKMRESMPFEQVSQSALYYDIVEELESVVNSIGKKTKRDKLVDTPTGTRDLTSAKITLEELITFLRESNTESTASLSVLVKQTEGFNDVDESLMQIKSCIDVFDFDKALLIACDLRLILNDPVAINSSINH